MLCKARSAYLSKFDVYLVNKETTQNMALGTMWYSEFTDQICQTFRWVFFDNFFNSMALLRGLLHVGLYACGTIREIHVGSPKDLKKQRDVVKRGDSKVLLYGDSNLTASAWMDERLVHHLSTLSDPKDSRDAQRKVGREVIHLHQPHFVSSLKV